jgi:TusA-related sulfurtransferase
MSSRIKYDFEVDCVGFYCPIPISMTKEKFDEIEIGQIVKIIADDPAAEEDIKRWAKRTGHKLLKVEKEETIIRFYIRKMN